LYSSGTITCSTFPALRVKELRAPVPDIEQPKEHCAYHGHGQEAAMMLGQRETDDG
jgi:hypothetical protein